MTSVLESLVPRVDRKILIFISGLMWFGVGIMLMSYAESWLNNYYGKSRYLFYVAGFAVAMPIHHFGFLKLADKNIRRLLPLTVKKCIFSFITWKSYFILIIMISLGIILRHSSIPKRYLSVLYNGIGLALFLSGIRYLRISLKIRFLR